MSDKNEQITRNTGNSLEDLEKDPQRFAAGKKLAEYNMRVKDLIV